MEKEAGIMKKILFFIYGVVAYGVFFLTFLYAIGFTGNMIVPKTVDSGMEVPLAQALVVNLVLLGAFAIQHSVMARPGFKKWWTQMIPKPIERSTYVLFSSVALILLYLFWKPILTVVWNVEDPLGILLFKTLFWVGWFLVLLSTFLINHFDLFGLRQVTFYLQGKEYAPIGFRSPGLYQYLRHPIMLGFIVAFWATPKMTLGHFLFSMATTIYIFLGIALEEKDLRRFFGEAYKRYQQRVPMLVPKFVKRK